MERCALVRTLAAASGCVLWLAAPAGAEDLPLPPDVKGMEAPYELVLGAQPVQASGFQTRLSPAEARAFYAKELPKRGWRVGPMPWMAQAMEAEQQIKRAVEEHRDEIAKDPEAQAKLARVDFAPLHAAAAGLVYAERSNERLLLRFEPDGGWTMVIANRWQQAPSDPAVLGLASGEGSSAGSAAQPQASLEAAAGGANWPQANPCCTGQSVPQALRQLPTSIPQYPGARPFATGADPQFNAQGGLVSELSVTEDPLHQVQAFYRRQMAFNGWSEMSVPPHEDQDLTAAWASMGIQMRSEVLVFRNDQASCVIGMTQGLPLPTDAAQASEQAGDAGVGVPGALPPLTDPSRTFIAINYMAAPVWSERGHGASRRVQ